MLTTSSYHIGLHAYLYSCINSGSTFDDIMEVAGFFFFCFSELSSWQKAGNATVLILFMLHINGCKNYYYNITHWLCKPVVKHYLMIT